MRTTRVITTMTVLALAVAGAVPAPAAAAPPAPSQAPPAAALEGTRAEQQAATDESSESRETVRKMEATSAERRAELRALAKTAGEQMDRRIEELQHQMNTRWARMDAAARSRSESAMTRLREERIAFAETMGRLDANSNAAWSEVRAGVVEAYRDMAAAASSARAQFQQPAPARAPKKTTPPPKKDAQQ